MSSNPLLKNTHSDNNTSDNTSLELVNTTENVRDNILLVDDEPYILQVMQEILEGDGYNTKCAMDADQALSALKKTPYPLVITDVRLGSKIDGLGLLKIVKRIRPDTIFIVITSYGTMEVAINALRMGAYDFITKPFDDIEILSISVQRAFEKIKLTRENRSLVKQLKNQNQELAFTNSKLETLAKTDGLTGLFNKRYFMDFLSREIVRSKRHQFTFSLLFLDIDNFKNYNDTHGHVAGDLLLTHTANCISDNVRRSDVVARYGGEEFIVILIQTGMDDARVVAEKIRASIEQYKHIDKTLPENGVTASIGISLYPDQGDDADILLENADSALYKAKSSGKNCVRVHS